ncbi:Akirin-2 [Camelus dromedarius]|uniref:Akirin-2 n=1 Tax=Camelus dromedarius TaxID=9838 RepID=A0A5N4DXI7_CAMDR|nr:Akirin-2 [Camelus dromedarius]
MACGATLKRTLDFDPLLSPASPKRRRCAPLSAPTSAAASPSSAAAATAASFSAAAASPQKYLRMEPSPFGDVSSRLTTGGTRPGCRRMGERSGGAGCGRGVGGVFDVYLKFSHILNSKITP